jgi:hypothetical protein
MRAAIIMLAILVALPQVGHPQGKRPARDLERFDVSGLPKAPSDEKERQILLFLRVHKKGDLTDATRIHMMLAEYYKARGDEVRADDCFRQAAESWDAANGTERTSARSPGKPPFMPAGVFRRAFTYFDELQVTHTWEFFGDGTFSHAVNAPSRSGGGPTELGWYSVGAGKVRLWQLRPPADRELSFELLGDDGKDGAVLDGVKMKPEG